MEKTIITRFVHTTMWMHYLDTNETHGEKWKWELHKNAICCFEQVLGASLSKQQLYDHLPPISQIIQVKQTRHAGHYWICKDELISNVLFLIPTHGQASVGWPAKTDIHQLCADTRYSLEDLPRAMDYSDGWWERESRDAMLSVWFDEDDRIRISFFSTFNNSFCFSCSFYWLAYLQRII